MKSFSEIEQRLILLKPFLEKKFKVKNIGVFGSYSDGTHNKNSDLDIIVDLYEPLGWEFFDLKEFLESEFKLSVDLVSRKALKNQIREQILSQTKFV